MKQRNTLHVEEAEILTHQSYPGEQFVMRLQAPKTAATARAGSFVHIRCDRQRPMRRPLSIMRCDPQGGWIELLYKAFGDGTRLLSQQPVGASLNLIGPIGRPFSPDRSKTRPLLLGGGVGIPPMIFLADELRRSAAEPLVLMGSEVPFPFQARPSEILVDGIPDGVIAAMPLLEDWHITSRLSSLQGYPGCYEGYITDLARHWLDRLDPQTRTTVEIFACGPHPMLAAVARLAAEYALPCQVSLEEFMACAVGGCAGCTVRIDTADGPAMKRVCVDGPVFEAAQVFPS
jgi:dihydroorotate dehydrogenase electron transfer subunit